MIEIHPHSSSVIKIIIPDDQLKVYVRSILTTSQEFEDMGGGMRTEYFPHYQNIPEGVLTHRWLLEFILAFFLFDRVPVDCKVDFSYDLQLTPRWREILGNNPKNPDQLKVTEQLLKFKCGIAGLYTSFGKTEMMLAIAESYLAANPGKKVLITSRTTTPIENLLERFSKYNMQDRVSQDLFDLIKEPQKDIFLISYASLYKTHLYQQGAYEGLFPLFSMLLTDECHNEGTYELMEKLSNLEVSYGFSATPNVYHPDNILAPTERFNQFGTHTGKMLSCFGPVRVFKKPKSKSLWLVQATGKLARPLFYEKYFNPARFINYSLVNKKFITLIKTILEKFPNVTFYMPVTTIKMGMFIYENLTKNGFKDEVIFWQKGHFHPEDIKSIEDMKERMSEGSKIRLLISTSVGYEGLDIPTISGCIMAVGRNMRVVLQPIGRSARNDNLIVVNVNDTNNPIMMGQYKKRNEFIKDNYHVSNIIHLEF